MARFLTGFEIKDFSRMTRSAVHLLLID